MAHRTTHRLLFALSISLTSLCALAACTTVPPNYGETTAPTLTWVVKVEDGTGATQTFTGSGGVIHTTSGTEYNVTLRADDAGGVKEITLDENKGWSCISGDTASQTGPSLGTQQKQDFTPDTNGNVLTSFPLFANETVTTFTCSSGYSLLQGEDSYAGTSTNFSGKQATSHLTFTVP